MRGTRLPLDLSPPCCQNMICIKYWMFLVLLLIVISNIICSARFVTVGKSEKRKELF